MQEEWKERCRQGGQQKILVSLEGKERIGVKLTPKE
jgi:hypothetical protein